MAYPDSESLIRSYSLTHHLINMQTDGLSNEESLLQLPFRGNCLNWVLGHILVGRNQALNALGEAPILGEEDIARYATGSEPIERMEKALSLNKLLEILDQSQEHLARALNEQTAASLGEPAKAGGGERGLGEWLAGLHWHETYHTGQLELLRQLAGTDDAIV